MIAITEKTADFSGGLFCIGSLAFEASRFRPCLQKGIAFAVGMCYHHIVNKLIPSSGQGASPYRWYSPRAARHDSVRFRSRQYSLDERRQNAQGSGVCSCVLDDCSGMCSFRSFLLRKGFCAPLSRPEPGVRGVSFANVCRNCFDDLQGISGKTPQNNRIKIFRAGCKSLPVV